LQKLVSKLRYDKEKHSEKVMRTNKLALGGLILSLSLGGLLMTSTGCAGTRYQRGTGEYIDDKAINTRVRAAMFRDPIVSGFDVGVNTYRGAVQLNGFVNTEEEKMRAENLAWGVNGVQNVINDLEIKPVAVGAPPGPVEGVSPATVDPGAPPRTEPDRLRDPGAARPVQQQQYQQQQQYRDTDVAPAAGAEIRDLQINVTQGRATVRGTVTSQSQSEAVERKVRELPGVQNVDNQLQIRGPGAQPTPIQ
jgi:hyperosmotically inducible periplasmic protein